MNHTNDNVEQSVTPEYLRLEEVGHLLRVSTKTARVFIKQRNIPRYKVTPRISLYKRDDIVKTLQSETV